MILQIFATNGRSERSVEAIESLAVNCVFENPAIAQFWNPATDGGRAALDAMITTQAQIIAYIDDFKLLMIATLVVIPLLLVFKQASGDGGDHPVAVK
ncbi:MAG: transporter, family, multidrug resistance protein [Alphaproteobacteria bacterium]|nr:transporter, family, multidrug resistance protein [Alphaproteobacteria bacterium]